MVSCPKFDIPHADANCPLPQDRKVDYLSLGGQRFAAVFFWQGLSFFGDSRFCQNSGPSNFTWTANKLTVTFVSNKAEEGGGAECNIACSDFTEQATASKPSTCFACNGLAALLEETKSSCFAAFSEPQPVIEAPADCEIFVHGHNKGESTL